MILIVDDEEFNLNALEIMLKYNLNVNIEKICTKARSGQEAIDLIKKNVESQNNTRCSYKLILIDYEMPGMNGPEATNKIRNYLY